MTATHSNSSVRLLPSGLRSSGLFPSLPLCTHSAVSSSYRLPPAGKCPKDQPSLTILIFDDSASVGMVGGTDPIGNRYQEAANAIAHVAKKCRCRKCLVAIVHLDTPTTTDVAPHSLRNSKTIEAGLRLPGSFAGISTLGPGLDAALTIAHDYPDYQIALVIFSDFWLTDSLETPAQLVSFPGEVFPIILGDHQAPEFSEAGLAPLNISSSAAAGALAKALFEGLTVFRVGV